MSRPPKGDAAFRSQITIPMTRAAIDRLELQARENGQSKTVLARAMLMQGLGISETVDG